MIYISVVVIPPPVLKVSKNLPVHSWGAVQDVLVQGDVGQERGEEVVVDQGGPDVGDPPWIGVGVLAVDVAGHQVVEHCVTEQFQPLICFCNPVVAIARVSEGLQDEGLLLPSVTDNILNHGDVYLGGQLIQSILNKRGLLYTKG